MTKDEMYYSNVAGFGFDFDEVTGKFFMTFQTEDSVMQLKFTEKDFLNMAISILQTIYKSKITMTRRDE
jgi:hypothetical protein